MFKVRTAKTLPCTLMETTAFNIRWMCLGSHLHYIVGGSGVVKSGEFSGHLVSIQNYRTNLSDDSYPFDVHKKLT